MANRNVTVENLVSALNEYENAGGVEFWEEVIPEFSHLVDIDASQEAESTEFGGYTCIVVLCDGSRILRDGNRTWSRIISN